jgi:hypothetical protein
MKVTIDFKRVLHLVILIVLTLTFGRLLTENYEWKPLAAYGLVCSLVCQLSNVIMKFHQVSDVIANNAVEADANDGSGRAKKTKMKSRKSR